jgi:hypothetical protein
MTLSRGIQSYLNSKKNIWNEEQQKDDIACVGIKEWEVVALVKRNGAKDEKITTAMKERAHVSAVNIDQREAYESRGVFREKTEKEKIDSII